MGIVVVAAIERRARAMTRAHGWQAAQLLTALLVAVIAVLGMIAAVNQPAALSWRYLMARAGTLAFVGTAQAASIALVARRPACLAWPTFRAFVVAVTLLSIWLVFRVPPSPTRVALAALLLVWLWSVAAWWLRPGLTATALALAVLAIPVLALEAPRHVQWGDDHTFQYLFPRQAPFIGPGGRLRPLQRLELSLPWDPSRRARFETNRLGFRNREAVDEVSPPGRVRILSLGDSFSTGFGVDQDRFFGSLIERDLRMARQPVRVLNAEVSDPAYGLFYLQRYGVGFSPDLVVYGLSGNDVMQAYFGTAAGGVFRLDDDRTLRPIAVGEQLPPTDWIREWRDHAYPAVGQRAPLADRLPDDLLGLWSVRWLLAGIRGGDQRRLDRGEVPSSIAARFERVDGRKRFVDGFSNLGFLSRRRVEPIELMYDHFFPLLDALAETSRRHGARFLLVIHPWRHQVQPQDWQALRDRWSLDPRDFDLDRSNRRILSHCRDHGIRCLDLAPAFRAAAAGANLYLPFDAHFNEAGQALAAREIVRHVQPWLAGER